MIIFPSGREYKLAYLDTNILSELINNNDEFAKNIIIKFFSGNDKYMFCTSIFNLYELSVTDSQFEDKMEFFFDKIPIGIVRSYEEIVLMEQTKKLYSNDVIFDSFGYPPIKKNIHDLLSMVRSMKDACEKRETIICHEIYKWNLKRLQKPANQRNALLTSMNEIGKNIIKDFSVSAFGKYKSLECMAFIKNEFIFNMTKKIEKNSIIDMYNLCVLPYVDVYVTERFVGSKINNEIKRKLPYIKAEAFFVKDFRSSSKKG